MVTGVQTLLFRSIADHRIGYKVYNLDSVLDGDLGPIISSAIEMDGAEKVNVTIRNNSYQPYAGKVKVKLSIITGDVSGKGLAAALVFPSIHFYYFQDFL